MALKSLAWGGAPVNSNASAPARARTAAAIPSQAHFPGWKAALRARGTSRTGISPKGWITKARASTRADPAPAPIRS